MIVDKLIFKDVQLTATNDDQYFVFEDVLYQVMLCFSRDPEIHEFLLLLSSPSDTPSSGTPETLAYTGANDDQTVRLLQLAGAALLIGTAMVAALRVSTTRRRRR